jgi:Ca2+-transporting ATPase
MIAVNTTANLDFSDKNNVKVIGNPTEGALLLWIQKKGIDYLEIRDTVQLIDRLPFTTENKYMATIVNSAVLGKKVVYVKCAPEILLNHCEINQETKNSLEKDLLSYQNKAMRTLGLAYMELNENDNIFNDGKLIVNKLKFVGIFAIQDDIREGVKESIQDCMNAGIAVKIVTGDTPGTAKEIGRKIGLWKDTDTEKNIITGAELALLTDKQLRDRAMDLKIIARARPMDKKRLV